MVNGPTSGLCFGAPAPKRSPRGSSSRSGSPSVGLVGVLGPWPQNDRLEGARRDRDRLRSVSWVFWGPGAKTIASRELVAIGIAFGRSRGCFGAPAPKRSRRGSAWGSASLVETAMRRASANGAREAGEEGDEATGDRDAAGGSFGVGVAHE